MNNIKKETKQEFSTLVRVIGLSARYKGLFIFCALLVLCLAPLTALRPYLINIGIDRYVMVSDLSGLWNMCAIIILFIFLEAIVRYLFDYFSAKLGQSITRDLRITTFKKITSLRMQHFDRTPNGIYITRLINDIENINNIYTNGFLNIIADLISIIVVLVLMFITSWELTLVSLVTLPLLIIATTIFNAKVRISYQKVRTQLANMNAFLQEHISGMNIIQAFNVERREAYKFRQINRAYTGANLKSVLYYAVFFPVVDIISAAALGLMVWWGARGIISDDVTFGAMVAFPIYINTLFRPLRMIADKYNTIQMGLIASERVFDLTDHEEFSEVSGTIHSDKLKGEIIFENVNFEYEAGVPILKDVSFEIPAGTSMAIVGSTGSGKSTIINLITKFYPYHSGHIRIDGHELRDLHKIDLRKNISLVLQDIFLFTGTIMDNVTLNNPDIDPEQVIKAGKILKIDKFIDRLPGKYDFNVSERGGNLSAGQRQLISLLRALVYDPSILILDEATSSIDTETEEAIQYAVTQLLVDRSAVIIAHRLSTISHCDQIIVMEKGRIIERGNHQSLMADENSRYRSLYTQQFEEEWVK
jgi:ATP-binding cassette subfamily B protein